jgi:hypothetical protein
MPLKQGMSMQSAMHDLKHGPHHKDRTHKQEVAIAMKYARKKKGKRKKGNRK